MAELVQNPPILSSSVAPETSVEYRAPEYSFRELNHDNLDGLVNTLFRFNKQEHKPEPMRKEIGKDKVIRQKFLELLQMLKE